MGQPAITGSGVFTPPEVITNAELVAAFNAYAERFNARHAADIAAGRVEAKARSSPEFILNASGIERRHVMEKHGILDPEVMYPRLRERGNDVPGIMAEMALDACGKALAQAEREASVIDLIICAASNHERPYSRRCCRWSRRISWSIWRTRALERVAFNRFHSQQP